MNNRKKLLIYVASFIIPIILLSIATFMTDIFPFGDKAFFAYDGKVQHPGFLSYFKTVLTGENSLLYSFQGGLGYNFFATFIYYLADLFNLFALFFKTDNLMYFYMIMSFIKIGLCGLSATIFFNKVFNVNKWNVLFGICYALMSYNILYFSNYMWINAVVLLPLILFGIEKLFGGKKLFYLLFLTLAILSNFYIGFMCVIFSGIYFVYKSVILKDKSRIKDFIILSLFSGLISSIFLIPVASELFNGKTDLYTNPHQTDYFSFSLDFFNSFYKLTISSFVNEDISYGLPNIYISLFIVTLVFLFFFNSKFSKREKIVTILIILFYLLCFSFNLFDYMWHMLQRPIWYPNRYSFTLSLFLIIVAYKSFINLKHLKLNKIFIVALSMLLLLIIGSGLFNKVYEDKVRLIFFIFSILLIVLYILIFKLNNKTKGLLVVFLFIELIINSFGTFKTMNFDTSTEMIKAEYSTKIKNVDKLDLDRLSRMEYNDSSTSNLGALYGYNGIEYFSSIRNNKAMSFFDNLGYDVIDECNVKFNSFNVFGNSFLNVKYFNGNNDEFYYEMLIDDGMLMYKNDLRTSFAYMINEKAMDVKLKPGSFIDNASSIINVNKDYGVYTKLMSNENDNGLTYKYKAEADGWIVYENSKDTFKDSIVHINGIEIPNISVYKTSLFVKKGDKVEIIVHNNEKLYFMNYGNFKEYIKDSNVNKFDVINKEKDHYIKGKVKVKDNKLLFTTIPFNKGWDVYVDGRKVKKKLVYDSFIGVSLDKGEHVVEFKYFPPGLKLGVLLSLLSIAGSVLYIKKRS